MNSTQTNLKTWSDLSKNERTEARGLLVGPNPEATWKELMEVATHYGVHKLVELGALRIPRIIEILNEYRQRNADDMRPMPIDQGGGKKKKKSKKSFKKKKSKKRSEKKKSKKKKSKKRTKKRIKKTKAGYRKTNPYPNLY